MPNRLGTTTWSLPQPQPQGTEVRLRRPCPPQTIERLETSSGPLHRPKPTINWNRTRLYHHYILYIIYHMRDEIQYIYIIHYYMYSIYVYIYTNIYIYITCVYYIMIYNVVISSKEVIIWLTFSTFVQTMVFIAQVLSTASLGQMDIRTIHQSSTQKNLRFWS